MTAIEAMYVHRGRAGTYNHHATFVQKGQRVHTVRLRPFRLPQSALKTRVIYAVKPVFDVSND